MVGIYMTFLKLDLSAMRRMEHIAVISIFKRQASLELVLHKVTAQLLKLGNGLNVMDASKQTSSYADLKTDYVATRGREGQMVGIPIHKVNPRPAYSLGDAPLQAHLGGCRSVNSTFLCRCCFCCQASIAYKSTIYDCSHEILEYRLGK